MGPFNRVKRKAYFGGEIDPEHEKDKLHAGWFPYGGKTNLWPELKGAVEPCHT